jgi:CTP:molybdopterin cytidylyltransferase MocA
MGQPKARICWQGRTFLEHICDRALQAGLQPCLVVQGAHPLNDLVAQSNANVTTNEHWEKGPFSSLQAGLHALSNMKGEYEGALVFTVDRPRMRMETLEKLIACIAEDPAAIVQPMFRGQRAHPIYLPHSLWPDALAMPSDFTLREALRQPTWLIRRKFMPCNDAGVIENFDTPESLRAANIEA